MYLSDNLEDKLIRILNKINIYSFCCFYTHTYTTTWLRNFNRHSKRVELGLIDNSYHGNNMTCPGLTWKESCQKCPVSVSGHYSATDNGICHKTSLNFWTWLSRIKNLNIRYCIS